MLLMLGGMLLLAASSPSSAAAARLNARTAAAAVERKVEMRYPRLVEDRLVVAQCRRRTRREYFCNYGIHANFDDALYEPEERWVYSGVGYARLRRGRVVAHLLPPRRGDDFAPWGRR
jgi:hypothetical protein